jgi:hypothetical protein
LNYFYLNVFVLILVAAAFAAAAIDGFSVVLRLEDAVLGRVEDVALKNN